MRAIRLAAFVAAGSLALSACGGADPNDETDVLGLVIDRESDSEPATSAPSEPTVDDTPSATETEPAPSETVTPTPSPEATPSPTPTSEPPPPPPPPAAETADAGEYPSGVEIWTINSEGVAERTLATAAGQTYERNDDGTTNTEPDLFGGAGAEAAGDTSILVSCSAAAQADDHRPLRISGSLTVEVLVDGAVVATATEVVDTTIAAGTTSALLSADAADPVSVGGAEGDDVELTCRVTLG